MYIYNKKMASPETSSSGPVPIPTSGGVGASSEDQAWQLTVVADDEIRIQRPEDITPMQRMFSTNPQASSKLYWTPVWTREIVSYMVQSTYLQKKHPDQLAHLAWTAFSKPYLPDHADLVMSLQRVLRVWISDCVKSDSCIAPPSTRMLRDAELRKIFKNYQNLQAEVAAAERKTRGEPEGDEEEEEDKEEDEEKEPAKPVPGPSGIFFTGYTDEYNVEEDTQEAIQKDLDKVTKKGDFNENVYGEVLYNTETAQVSPTVADVMVKAKFDELGASKESRDEWKGILDYIVSARRALVQASIDGKDLDKVLDNKGKPTVLKGYTESIALNDDTTQSAKIIEDWVEKELEAREAIAAEEAEE